MVRCADGVGCLPADTLLPSSLNCISGIIIIITAGSSVSVSRSLVAPAAKRGAVEVIPQRLWLRRGMPLPFFTRFLLFFVAAAAAMDSLHVFALMYTHSSDDEQLNNARETERARVREGEREGLLLWKVEKQVELQISPQATHRPTSRPCELPEIQDEKAKAVCLSLEERGSRHSFHMRHG